MSAYTTLFVDYDTALFSYYKEKYGEPSREEIEEWADGLPDIGGNLYNVTLREDNPNPYDTAIFIRKLI